MKKLWFWVVCVILSSLVGEVFAQTADADNVYYQSVPILKVLKHRLGYKVYYIRNDSRTASAYIPLNWMKGDSAKGQIIWGKDVAYPYMAIFWSNNKFDHVKLYVRPIDHPTWGVLKSEDEETLNSFKAEELKFEF